MSQLEELSFELPPEAEAAQVSADEDFGSILEGEAGIVVDEHYDELERASQAELEESQRQYAKVETGMEQFAPDLLEGRLPAEMAKLIGHDYALGFNQSGALTAEDAEERIKEAGSITVTNHGVPSRFMVAGHDFTDPYEAEYARGVAIRGYYGPHEGKFVVALPVAKPGLEPELSVAQAMRGAESDQLLPDEFYQDSDNEVIVNPKYYAGFVDTEGHFYPNPDFMRAQEVHHIGASALKPDML